MNCPHCGEAIGPDARFCSQCGAALSAAAGQEPFGGERRQLTALFCDLVQSTEIAKTRDPEEYHEIIRDFARCCREAVAPFEGHVAELRGDGALVFFGYPRSHGDEPERALRAALGTLHAVAAAGAARGISLNVRIGIATGLMAIDRSVLDKPAIVGEAVILASRLQEIAAPNTIVASALTMALAGGFFDVVDLGPQALKGFAEPVRAWQVLRARTMPSRFKGLHIARLSPFVGRAREQQVILDGWQRAKGGKGSVIVVSGEPGIGKSRLMRHVRDLLRQEVRALEYFCSPYQISTSLFPITDRLARLADFRPGDSVERRLGQLRMVLAAAGPAGERHLPSFAAMMSVPLEGSAQPVTPQQRKQKMFDALLWWVAGHARRAPQLVVLEDAHWCDPTSRELLDVMADWVPTVPVLMIVSVRAPHEAPWMNRPAVTRLRLDRLSEVEAGRIVERLSDGAGLEPAMIEQILKKTDGIPLFIEEFTRMVLGMNASLAGTAELPATLQDSLAARLDQLAPDKQAAQCAAVIGREFSYALLAAVAPLAPDVLQSSLERLTEAGFMEVQGGPDDRRYLFRHALVRDAAYESLLKRDRRKLHGAVAAAIGRLQPTELAENAELLAYHFTEAGSVPEALKYWAIAAQRAMQKAAYLEVIEHTTHALDLLATTPDSPERRARELGFRFLAGGALWSVRGFSSADVEETFTRALELAQEIGSEEQAVMALRGLFGCHYARGELDRAFAQGEAVAALVARGARRSDRIFSHVQKGSILFWRGDLASARRELEAAVGAYDPALHRTQIATLQIDPGANATYHLGWTLWSLGFPEQGLATAQRAVDAGRAIAQPLTLAMALFWASAVRLNCGDLAGAAAAAGELREVTTEFHIRYLGATAIVLDGAILLERGELADGLARLQAANAMLQGQNAGLGQPWTMALLAGGCLRSGAIDDGLRAVETGFAAAARNGEAHWSAELHRLKAELLLARGPSDAKAAALELAAALRTAKGQGALSLELRAATSLARMLASQGDRGEARALLGEVRDRFTEGFATRDLQAATRLLGELEAGPASDGAAGPRH